MPIWRKLHVKTTDSLDVNDMPDDFTRLMWVLLPLKLCREGRGIDMPQWIKSQLFPLRSDVTLEQVTSAMRWYQERGMIRRYTIDNRPYFHIVNWHDYQGSTEREAKSPYRAPREEETREDIDVDIDASQMTYSRANHDLLKSNSKAIPLPVHFGGELRQEMEQKWIEWQVYQAERGKPITKSTANRQFQDFYQWGPERTIRALDYSIKNNYTGLIEPRQQASDGSGAEPLGFQAVREVMEEINNGNS